MTKIEWAQQTWNPIAGCSIVSPGCTNCYAMRMAARLEQMAHADNQRREIRGEVPASPLGHYIGITHNDMPVWNGRVALAPDSTVLEPLTRKGPTLWFVNSMSDLFHEKVPNHWIDRVFAIMALSPRHTFQVLTKRSARMRDYISSASTCIRVLDKMFEVADLIALRAHLSGKTRAWEARPRQVPFIHDPDAHWPLANVWLGVSAERQQEAEQRIPNLLATPAAIRFISAEPLLGRIDLTHLKHPAHPQGFVDALRFNERRLDWVIAGGESGPGARPMHPDWAREIRDQCVSYGVPFFFKQHGNWTTVIDRDRDDPDWRLDYSQQYANGNRRHRWLNIDGGIGFHGARFHVMKNVGRVLAGRLLDGKVWDEMPSATYQQQEVSHARTA